MRKATLFVILSFIILYACSVDPASRQKNGKTKTPETSKEIEYGGLIFSEENLKAKNFLNGDPIPRAQTSKEWKIAAENGQAAWCYSDKKNKDGELEVLYNYFALTDPRGIVKKSQLLNSEHVLEMESQMDKDDKIRKIFKSEFTGERNYAGKFFDLDVVNWWVMSSSTEDSTKASVCCWSPDEERCYISKVSKGNGFLVRCLKN